MEVMRFDSLRPEHIGAVYQVLGNEMHEFPSTCHTPYTASNDAP